MLSQHQAPDTVTILPLLARTERQNLEGNNYSSAFLVTDLNLEDEFLPCSGKGLK